MYASGGNDEKNAVSKIATCGTLGSARCAPRMPAMPGGLCSGASGDNTSRVSITASSMSIVLVNLSPPCTVRWPTATTSARAGPRASNMSTIAVSARVWLLNSSLAMYSAPPTLWVSTPSARPMRSIRPDASTPSLSASMTWYLIELEPALSSRMGVAMVFVPSQLCWAWMAVMAMVLTMSSTNAPRERSLTGLLSPCRTGPTASAPADRCTAL